METPTPGPLEPNAGPHPDADPDAEPLWPAWYAFVGLIAGLVGTVVVVGMVAAVLGGIDDTDSAEFVVIGTVIQGGAFALSAIGFAGIVKPPKLWHFGLVGQRPFWKTIAWAAGAMVTFYVFAALYYVAVQPDSEQTVTQDLGADQGTLGLIVAGVTVIVVAPIVEEFFFRGFFYKALRTSLSVVPAGIVVGVLFGLVHYTDPDSLQILPPLAVLGFLFCFVYERTGTLLAPIGMHAVNNMIAYAAQADDGWMVSVAVGPLMLAGVMLAGRLLPPAPAARSASPPGTVVGR